MTPNEYNILRMFANRDSVTVRQVAKHLQNSLDYSEYLCAGMTNAGLLTQCQDDSGKRPERAYRLTTKSQGILMGLWSGMEGNLRRRVARFRRVAAIVEERADRLGQMALSPKVSDEEENAVR